MAEGIDRELDGGGMDMYPDQTRTALTALDQVPMQFGARFDALIGEIAGLDSQPGTDLFGAAFAMQYQPAVDELVPQVRELNDAARGYAANGFTIVNAYVKQDAENKATVQGAGN